MVFSYAKKNPIDLDPIAGQAGRDISQCLHISWEAGTGLQGKGDEVTHEETSEEKDWY